MTRRVPCGLVASTDVRRRARSRGVRNLQLESLESRYAFCTDLADLAPSTVSNEPITSAEGELVAPFYGPMPVAYYAQFSELPAQFPTATPETVDSAVTSPSPVQVDAAIMTLDLVEQGEGETTYGTTSYTRGKPPRIVEFNFEEGRLGGLIVYGKIEDDDGPLTGLAVNFYGVLEGRSAIASTSGYFSFYIPKSELPRGLGEADVVDLNGNRSERVSKFF